MILVFDIGNTNIVFGVMDDGKVLHQFRLHSDFQKTTDEYAMAMLMVLNHHNISMDNIDCIIMSSVVPPLTYTLCRMINKYFGREPIVVTTASDHGIDIKLEFPHTLGTDRLMTAVATHKMYKSNCITVDYGTATTIEALTHRGEFLGGIIFPGVKLSAQALHINTAQLPQVEIAKPTHVIATNTTECIQSGLYYGYIDMVDGLIDRVKKERFEGEEVKVVATGGLGSTLSADSRHHMQYEPSLILYGLYFMYLRLNKKS